MVHLRLNESETNPNPHVNFITALPSIDQSQHEDARQLLRALAAQVRPVMKAHGFTVNSFEEYEHNRVFLGRNWNNGETVELVLRSQVGTFYPTSMLMSTLCHELAHIKHMNHGPAFQALWKRLRIEVRQLQDRGYYGDGYWSAGTRLADSTRISGEGIEAGDFPEYMCGGAQTRTRPTATRRRRPTGKRRETIPSLHTGRQTAKKRKAGARVTSKYAFSGEGSTLAEEESGGKGKGKQAASKRAREERALAAERRLQALQADTKASAPSKPERLSTLGSESEYDSDEVEIIGETDAERRERLLSSAKDEDGDDMPTLRFGSWGDFDDDFNFSGAGNGNGGREGEEEGCNLPVPSGSTFTSGGGAKDKGKGRRMEETPVKLEPMSHQPASSTHKPIPSASSKPTPSTSSKPTPSTSSKPKPITQPKSNALGIGQLVQSEIDFRKKEFIGLAPVKSGGRTLGGSGPSRLVSLGGGKEQNSRRRELSASRSISQPAAEDKGRWTCLVCTLENEPSHLACSACAMPCGEEVWSA